MKKLIIGGLTIIIVIIALFIFKPFSKADRPVARAVQASTAIAERGNIIISINSTGVIEPVHTVELKSKASGEIIEFPLEEGDQISRGQLIVRLDPTTARNEYDQARADLEVAKVALSQADKQAARQKQMYDQGMISELEYENILLEKEQANSDVVRARTAVSDASERLSDTEIESPVDGIILQKNVEEGQIIASGISEVSGGTAIALVADLSKVYVRTSVDEVDIGQVRSGQSAMVIAEAYPDREFEGEVIRVHPQAKIEQNVTTFDVTVEIDNKSKLLMAGMNASVEIIAGYKEDVLLVPREALTDAKSMFRMIGMNPSANGGQRPATAGGGRGRNSDNNGNEPDGAGMSSKMVILLNNGEQEPRPIEIGLANFEKVEVISGLNEGDTVLTTVSSKALADREEMLERMRSWNQIPGMRRR